MREVGVIWLGFMLGLLLTPRGHAILGRFIADMRHVLGFDRRGGLRSAARRWHDLAAEDARDPALRRAATVKDAYVAGEFGPDELDWRILVALCPPTPGPSTHERNWGLAQQAIMEHMMEIANGGTSVVVPLLLAPPKPSDSERSVRRQSHG